MFRNFYLHFPYYQSYSQPIQLFSEHTSQPLPSNSSPNTPHNPTTPLQLQLTTQPLIQLFSERTSQPNPPPTQARATWPSSATAFRRTAPPTCCGPPARSAARRPARATRPSSAPAPRRPAPRTSSRPPPPSAGQVLISLRRVRR